MAKLKKRRYGLGVQSVGVRPQPPKPNVGKNITNVATSAAAGAATGSAGGPIGTAIGGLIGLTTGLLSNKVQTKADQENFKAQLGEFQQGELARLQGSTLRADEQVLQLGQAANGVAATDTEPIEVEKDELIFSRSNGKFILKADVSGGKTHNQGGENFQAEEGDVIFPGKDRKKVLAAHKRGDFAKLESMRLKLPKDTKIAQNGLDNTDPTDPVKKARRDALALKSLTGLTAEEQIEFDEFEAASREKEKIDFLADAQAQVDAKFSLTPAPLDKLTFKTDNLLTQPVAPSVTPAVETPQPSNVRGGTRTAIPRIDGTPIQNRAVSPGLDLPANFGAPTQATGLTIAPVVQNAPRGQFRDALGKTGQFLGDNAGTIAQLGAATAGLFPGETEVQRTPDVALGRLQHEDTSAPLRQASKLNERVARSNAISLSGGNVQSARANQRAAGIQNLRNLQNINNQEFGRAQGIANQNVRLRNQETLINAQSRKEDALANAQNRAVATQSRLQAIQQLGALGGQFGQDKNKRKTEGEMIKTLNDLGLFELLQGGGVGFKGN